MREPIDDREPAIGVFVLADFLDERMETCEPREPFLDLALVDARRLRDNRRVELGALHAAHDEQPAIRLIDPVDLQIDHVANRLGDLAQDFDERPRERPDAVSCLNRSARPQAAQEFRQEERMPLGARMDQVDERRGQAVRAELHREIAIDVGARQKLHAHLAADPARLQIDVQPQERMLRQVGIRGPIGHEQQHLRVRQPPRDVRKKVHGRDVAPVDVFDQHDDRPRAGGFFEKHGQLALEPFLRSAAIHRR